MSHTDTLRQLFADLESIDFEAVASWCAEDCRYEDVPVGDAWLALLGASGLCISLLARKIRAYDVVK